MISGTIDINTLGWLVVGVLTLINTYYSRKTEKNTNSMKDALVKKTGEASHAAGLEEGRIAGEAKAAVLAAGQLKQGP